MKKLIYAALGRPEVVDLPAPRCASDTMLLRTLYSGLSNGTERNQLVGGNYNASHDFPHHRVGYQAVSEVVETGAAITRFAKGDIVATGTFGTHAELHTARESDLITRLPAGFDLPSGALLSVAAVALRNVKRAEVTRGDKVLVCGGGPIGQLALQLCRLRGAEALLLTRGEARARLAIRLGTEFAGHGDEAEQDRFLAAHRPFNVVIETSGSPTLLSKLVGAHWGDGVFGERSRGRLVVLAGYGQVTYSGNAAQAAELALLHSGHFSPEDHHGVIALAHSGQLVLKPLIQDVVPAADIVSIYQRLRDEPSRLFGTVFDWTASGRTTA